MDKGTQKKSEKCTSWAVATAKNVIYLQCYALLCECFGTVIRLYAKLAMLTLLLNIIGMTIDIYTL